MLTAEDKADPSRIPQASDGRSQSTGLHTPANQSLPSFATFSEHTAARVNDPDVDGPAMAPMASRMTCNSCNKMRSMMREVAVAVSELDELVQHYCNGSAQRVSPYRWPLAHLTIFSAMKQHY